MHDQAFGLALYASTRAQELAASGWPPALQQAFLAQQHGLREAHYARQFPQGEDCTILRDGQAVGRCLVAIQDDALHLVDLALLPEARGAGLGTRVLRQLQQRAANAGLLVRLQVTADNPGAERLYRRLGFHYESDADEGELYRTLCWRPEDCARVA